MHESIILSFTPPTCIAHPGAILLHDYWAVYDSPSDLPCACLYTVQYWSSQYRVKAKPHPPLPLVCFTLLAVALITRLSPFVGTSVSPVGLYNTFIWSEALCARINPIIRKHPPCLGTPPPPLHRPLYTLLRSIVFPPTTLCCNNCHTILVMAISWTREVTGLVLFAARALTATGLGLYKMLFWLLVVPARINRPFTISARLHCPHCCNIIARLSSKIRPPPQPPLCMPCTIQYW